MANKKGVLMYYDILDQLKGFTDEEFGKIVKALIIYDRDGTLPNFDRSLMIAFNCIRPSIDRNKEEYESKCEMQRKKIQDYWDSKKIQMNTTEYNSIQMNTMATDNDIDNDIEKDKDIDKDNKKKVIRKKNFIAPTKEEVYEYARQRDRLDLVDKFYDYFTAGNWIDSEGKKVRNWKQKFVTWENRNPKPKDYNIKYKQTEPSKYGITL